MKKTLFKIAIILLVMSNLPSCQQNTCSNGVLDGSEIGIDCGGIDCAPCVVTACTGIGGTFVSNNDIVLSTQAQVDSFGAFEYDVIDGSMFISSIDIIDLSPLCSLKEVKGELRIYGNIISLDGFHNIEKIGRSLIINSISSSVDLVGFTKLKYVGRNIIIGGSTNSNQLNSLSLNSTNGNPFVSGGLIIMDNINLKSFTATNIEFGFELFITNSVLLTSIDLISNDSLFTVVIDSCSSLLNVDFLSNLKYVENNINIYNTAIENIDALSNLHTTGNVGGLHLGWNYDLKDYCGLNNPIFQNLLDSNDFSFYNNLYNPSYQNIINGDCSI